MSSPPDRSLHLTCGEEVWWIEFRSRNNTIGSSLMTQLGAALERHAQDASAKVLVLQGGGSKFFSPGLDLMEVAGLNRERMSGFMRQFRDLYRRLYSHPKPTLAALNGHALAGGAILAGCCDFRLARASTRVGLTELNRSVPVPYGSLLILQTRIEPSSLREAVFFGLNYAVEEARVRGWVDAVVEAEAFQRTLVSRVEGLRAQDSDVFAAMKRALVDSCLEEIDRGEDPAAEVFLDCWFSETTQTRIQDLARRLGGKSRPGQA